MSRSNACDEVSQLNPAEIRAALQRAAALRDSDAIDRLTLQLHELGLARHPSDGSRFESLSAIPRNPHPGTP